MTTATDSLAALIVLADNAGAIAIARQAREIARRLNEGRFFVAVLGQFKRGKSTLINALVDAPVLPTGVAPVTSVITVLRYGTNGAAQVQFRDGTRRPIALGDLTAYVTEAENPENTKGVLAVEIEVPARLLERGLCVVDTPGLGSVFAGNTNETREFIPHIDAAILVVGADPPITGEEADLLETLGEQTANVLVVISKADRMPAADLAEARAFTGDVLRKTLPGQTVPVFALSSRESRDTRDWPALLTTLERLATESAATLVESARARETSFLRVRLLRYLDEAIDALRRPLAETEARVATLIQTAEEAERSLGEIRHLFDAEQHRIARDLENRRAAFISAAAPQLRKQLESSLVMRDGENVRRVALENTRAIVEAAIRTWRDQLKPDVERAFEAAGRRFIDNAMLLLSRIRDAGVQSTIEDAAAIDITLRARSGFYFRPIMTEATTNIASRVVDRVRSPERAIAGAVASAMEYGERVLESNSRGVAGDYIDRIVETRRGIETQLQRVLRDAVVTASDAVERARALHARGTAAVRAELDRLTALQSELGA